MCVCVPIDVDTDIYIYIKRDILYININIYVDICRVLFMGDYFYVISLFLIPEYMIFVKRLSKG